MQTTAANERGTVNEALDQQRTATGIVSSVTAEQITREPRQRCRAGRTAGERRDGTGWAVRVRPRARRAVHDGVAQRRAYPESGAGEARRAARPVPVRACCSRSRRRRRSRPISRAISAARRSTSRRASFPARRQITYSLTTGFNSGSTGSNILTAPRAGGERFAFVGTKRNLPWLVASVGNFQQINLNQGDKNLLINTFRNSWAPTDRARVA